MSTKTKSATRTAEFGMKGAALLAAAMERTAKGAHTAGATRARAEIARRDAKNAAKATPVASSAPAKVTEADVVDLVAEARKVANAIARSEALLATGGGKGSGFQAVFFPRRKELLAEALADPAGFLGE